MLGLGVFINDVNFKKSKGEASDERKELDNVFENLDNSLVKRKGLKKNSTFSVWRNL